MKKIAVIFLGIVGILSFQFVGANVATIEPSLVRAMSLTTVDLSPKNVINWKVGDSMDYDVKMVPFGGSGTMHNEVTSDEGDNLWLRQEMNLQGKQVMELLIRKADGAVLKLIRNGKEEKLPEEGTPEIVEQKFTTVTVPAGTFDALYMKLNTKDAKGMEIWANPQETALDGGLKTIVPTQFFVKIEMQLTAFHRN